MAHPYSDQSTPYKTEHIQFYGAPGVGKSLLATLVQGELKMRGVVCEMVQEHAKELMFRGQLRIEDQLLIAHEQLRREQFYDGYVPYLVTESPPLLGATYALQRDQQAIMASVMTYQRNWSTRAFLLQRQFSNGYEQIGRREDLQKSNVAGRQIQKMLSDLDIPHQVIQLSDDVNQMRDVAFRIASLIEPGPMRSTRPLLEAALHG